MSTSTTPLRVEIHAEAILNTMNQAFDDGISPSDIAVTICTIIGEKVSRAGCGVATHQSQVNWTRGWVRELLHELGNIHSAMDTIAASKQDEAMLKAIGTIIGGEGGGAPSAGITTETAALPRSLDTIMDHPVAQIDNMISEAFPDRDARIDATNNELATEDAANDIPLAVIGNGSYQTRIDADDRCPRVPK